MTSQQLMVQILTWICGAGTRNPVAPATLRCMPLPPLRQSDWPPARVTIESPREAALRAIVYRNQLREKPRERGLRIAGLVGTLLVHLIFLFGAILGPAYQPDALPSEPLGVLHVRLIDNKPEPPPCFTTFGAGQPQFTSRMSAPTSCAISAAMHIRSGCPPKI